MANFFDQFDEQPAGATAAPASNSPNPPNSPSAPAATAPKDNYFDQFDPPAPSPEPQEDLRKEVGKGLVTGVPHAIEGTIESLPVIGPAIGAGITAVRQMTGAKPEDVTTDKGRMKGVSDYAEEGLSAIHANPSDYFEPPKTAMGRIARMAGEGIVAGIMPGGEETGLARLVDMGKNLIAGGMGGVAAQGTVEALRASGVDEKYLEPAATLAGFAGGIGGHAALGTLSAVPRVLKGAKDYVEGAIPTQKNIERQASKKVGSIVDDRAASMDALNQPGAIVPGEQPTSAKQTGDRGLLQYEASASRNDPEFNAKLLQRRQDNDEARTNAMEGIRGPGAPMAAADAFRTRLADLESRADDLYQRAQTGAGDAHDAAVGTRQAGEVGEQGRGAITSKFRQLNTEANQLWDSVDPNHDLHMASGPLVRAGAKIYGMMSPEQMAGMSPDEKVIANLIGNYDDVIPFSRFKDLRSLITGAMRTANSPVGGNAMAFGRLSQLRGAVEDAVSDTIAARTAEDQRKAGVEAAPANGQVAPEGDVNEQGKDGSGSVPGAPGAPAAPEGNGGSDLPPAREADGSLRGLPRKAGNFRASAHGAAQEVAKRYTDEAGIDYQPPATYAKVVPERAKRIADAYDAMEHNPNDPTVKRAYDAMTKETLAQYDAMLKDGMKIEFIPDGAPDPYKGNPRNMTEDVRNNKHMWVFPTKAGFGSDAAFDATQNPLLADSGQQISGQPATFNDIFRAVHDYFGHAKEGVGFRADGEENAWRAHSAMYSPEARKAMTSETRGQNSWVNYGPHGETNRAAKSEDTHYADQKIGILPDWAVHEGAGDGTVADTTSERFASAGVPADQARAIGAINDAFYKTMGVTPEQYPLPEVFRSGSAPEGALAQSRPYHPVTALLEKNEPTGYLVFNELKGIVKDAYEMNARDPDGLPLIIDNDQPLYKRAKALLSKMGYGDDELDASSLGRLLVDEVKKYAPTEEQWNKDHPVDTSRPAPNPDAKPTFYSAALKSVEDSKTTKAPGGQWLATLKNTPGIKKEEMDWLGLEPWLKDQQGPVTKEQIADYIRANQMEVEETDLTGEPIDSDSINVDWQPVDADEFDLKDHVYSGSWSHDRAKEEIAEERHNEGTIDENDPDLIDDDDPDVQKRALEKEVDSYNEEPEYTAAVIVGGIDFHLTKDQYGDGVEIYDGTNQASVTDGYDHHINDDADIANAIRRYMIANDYGDGASGDGSTKYHDYADKGGQDYHELLLKLPNLPGAQDDYNRSHWDEPNVVAHVRFDTRNVNGKKTLFIQEVQSDWHQQGQEQGYASDAETMAQRREAAQKRRDAASEAWDEAQREHIRKFLSPEEAEEHIRKHGTDIYYMRSHLRDRTSAALSGLKFDPNDEAAKTKAQAAYKLQAEEEVARNALYEHPAKKEFDTAQREFERTSYHNVVPDAPFKTTWPDLAMKRMIRWGAENGFDQIAWTPGDLQNGNVVTTPVHHIEYRHLDDGQIEAHYADKDGFNVGSSHTTGTPDEIGQKFGKDVADKMVANDGAPSPRDLRGSDIKRKALPVPEGTRVGGDIQYYYGKALPSTVNKMVKKFGVGVTRAPMKLQGENISAMVLPLTDEMKKSAIETGQPLFQSGQRGAIQFGQDGQPDFIHLLKNADASTGIHELAHKFLQMYGDLAGKPDAPAGLRGDWNTVKGWWKKNAEGVAKDAEGNVSARDVRNMLDLGSTGDSAKDDAIHRGLHEQWARAFESYLRDGRAPTPGLRAAFDRFKDWMANIYRSMRGLNVDLSPEMKGVFDRMLGGKPLTEKPGPKMMDEAAAQRFQQATAATKNIKETYGAAPIKPLLKRPTRTGPFDLSDEGVSDKLWRPGAPGAATIDGARKAAGNSPEMESALEGAAMLSLRRKASVDGRIDPAKFEAWRSAHSDALAKLPQIEGKLRKAADATRVMQDVGQRRAKMIKDMQATAVGKLAGLSSGDDITRQIGSMLGGKDAVKNMRQLATEAHGNPAAEDGLRAAVIDHMMSRLSNTNDSLSHAMFSRYLGRNAGALNEVLTPEQMNGLRAVAQSLKRESKSIKAPGGGSDTAQNQSAAKFYGTQVAGSLLGRIMSRFVGNAFMGAAISVLGAPLTGAAATIGGATAAMGNFAVQSMREAGMARVDDLVKQAILDPELMKKLLAKAPAKPNTGSEITLAKYLERMLFSTAKSARLGYMMGKRQ